MSPCPENSNQWMRMSLMNPRGWSYKWEPLMIFRDSKPLGEDAACVLLMRFCEEGWGE